MSFDRREKPRVGVPEALNATFALGADGHIAGRVLDLSERGALVLVPAGAVAPEDLGRAWDVAVLAVRGRRVPLDLVTVRRVEPAHGGEHVALQVHDPASQAALWSVCDEVRAGPFAAADPTPRPAAMPDRGHYTEAARVRRLDWVREQTGADLPSLQDTGLDARALAGNVENLVGTVEVPVGLAGPLLFTGERAAGWITAPMATTEGALVASASRGASALSRAGGVTTRVLARRMARAPLYELDDIPAAMRLVRWIADHDAEIRARVREVSSHAELMEIAPLQIGSSVHLRFVYETGDAAGQNMTTACTWHACRWINETLAAVPGLDVRAFFLDGNSSGDKKLTHLNLALTRGTRVTAEARLDADTVRRVLKLEPRELLEGHQRAVVAGQLSGMVGYNVNVANVVAALFTATGQDIACVQESGGAILSVQPDGDGIRASLLLPGIVVGTVGGGTALPNQRDYLDLLGCAGDDGADRLAEIVAGFALALDISTLAAMVGGQFADAHERLGRNRPVEWFTERDLGPELLQPIMARSLGVPDLEVAAVERLDSEMASGTVSEVTAHTAPQKLIGVLPLRLTVGGSTGLDSVDVVVKSKPLDDEVILATNRVVSLWGGELASAWSRFRDEVGFAGSLERELALYRDAPPALRAVMPRLHGIHADPGREAFLIVMENLDGRVILKDSVGDVSGWTTARIDAALTGIAGAHSVWLGREERLLAQPWLGPVPDARRMHAMHDLWIAMAEQLARRYPRWIDGHALALLRDAIADIPLWWAELEAMPRTLVHNDFSPRNIALRPADLGLVAYDWELATLHVPQRDLAELLVFTLTAEADPAVVAHHVDVHRRALEDASGVALDPAVWRRGYRLALRDFLIARMGLFLIAHSQQAYDFLERVMPTARRLIDIELDRERNRDGAVKA